MKKYFILAAAALALGACSNDEGSNVANDGTINLTTEMRGGTRALDQDIQATQIANGKSVLVEFTTTATPDQNEGSDAGKWNSQTAKAVYVANGSGNLSTTTPVKWPSTDHSGTVSIFAWAPNTKITTVPTAGTTFSVEADQSTDDNYIASDYLYGTAAAFSYAAIATPVLVKFDHMLAKINVNLFTTVDGLDLSGAKVVFKNSKPTGEISATDGTISNPSGAADITMTSSILPTGSAYTCSAIIIPQTIAAGKQIFEITLTAPTDPSNPATKVKKYTLLTAKTYQAKNVYNYNITINDSETIVLSEQINPWTTNSSNNESVIATN